MNFTRQWTLLLESLKIFALNMFQKRQRVAKNSETYIGFTTLKHVKNVGSSSKFSHFRKNKTLNEAGVPQKYEAQNVSLFMVHHVHVSSYNINV